ncbi:uncharacterized protein ISCGN_000989 [Ixodes scapularis]
MRLRRVKTAIMSSAPTRHETTTTAAPNEKSHFWSGGFNRRFLSSVSSFLTLLELSLGIAMFELLYNVTGLSTGGNLLMLISFSYGLTCLYVFLSECFSPTETLLSSTLFFFLFNVFGTVIYLACGFAVVLEAQHAETVMAGVLALISAFSHLFHMSKSNDSNTSLGIAMFELLYNVTGLSTGGNLLMLISFSYGLTCLYVFLSECFSPTETLLSSTLFFFLFNVFGTVIYLACGFAVVLEAQHAETVMAGVLALISAFSHLFHMSKSNDSNTVSTQGFQHQPSQPS